MDQKEIVDRAKARQKGDMFGFEWMEYLKALDWEHAQEFLKDEAKTDEKLRTDWTVDLPNREAVLKCMKDYLEFAFGKAHDQRGISASRSLSHYVAWAWLAGDKDFSDEIERLSDSDYAPYGLPVLRRICEFYGWDPKEHGDE
jgi:hypothetical protein